MKTSLRSRLSSRLAVVSNVFKADPVLTSNLTAAALSVVVGVGVPVSEDLKVGIIGLIVGGATIAGRSQVTATKKLVDGEVLQSEPGEPVTVRLAGNKTMVIGTLSNEKGNGT